MKVLHTQAQLQLARGSYNPGTSVALVPTMGALHQGHLSLVELAQKNAQLVFVSIFVNPLQFSQGEDFTKYPRTLESDLEKLQVYNPDFVWAPSVEEMYPSPPVLLHANKELADCLCGLARPGHFDGVVTVVNALFDQVKPTSAIFGEKDFQQLLIIKSMVQERNIAVEIVSAPIIREESGLAMSSRNQYLSDSEKILSANIYKELIAIKNSSTSIDSARNRLIELGFKIDYLEKRWGRVFFAGKIGSTRLIDNL